MYCSKTHRCTAPKHTQILIYLSSKNLDGITLINYKYIDAINKWKGHRTSVFHIFISDTLIKNLISIVYMKLSIGVSPHCRWQFPVHLLSRSCFTPLISQQPNVNGMIALRDRALELSFQ